MNVLIATYYEDVGWIPEDHNRSSGLTSDIKKLVNGDLLRITNLVRGQTAVHSFGDGGFVRFVSDPLTSHCAVAITEAGKMIVEQINISRRADACVVEGDIYIIRSFVNSLDTKDLPEFLSHSHQQIREEASKRLDDCLELLPAEDLPQLLTDSDSIVRDTANRILVYSIGVEE